MGASLPERLSGGRLLKSLRATNPSPRSSGRNVVGTYGEAAAGCVGTAGGEPWLAAPGLVDGGEAAADRGGPGRSPRQRARTGHAARVAGARSYHLLRGGARSDEECRQAQPSFRLRRRECRLFASRRPSSLVAAARSLLLRVGRRSMRRDPKPNPTSRCRTIPTNRRARPFYVASASASIITKLPMVSWRSRSSIYQTQRSSWRPTRIQQKLTSRAPLVFLRQRLWSH